MILIAIVVFIVLFVVPAGYGQMIKQKWGSTVNNRVGWVIMEFPVVLFFFLFWIFSGERFDTVPLIFFCLFNLHYIQRTFIFPALIRGNDLMPFGRLLALE